MTLVKLIVIVTSLITIILTLWAYEDSAISLKKLIIVESICSFLVIGNIVVSM